jgi:hypothetical protein
MSEIHLTTENDEEIILTKYNSLKKSYFALP